MSPFLASCLTVLFILWLLYRNTKTEGRVSVAVWLPTLWLISLASRPLGSWFGGQSTQVGGAADGSPIDRSVLLALIVSAIFVLVRRGLRWGEAIRGNRWLWVFFLYLLVSVVWSDFPFVAFKRWFREFGNLLMILVILTEEDPEAAIRQAFVRCAYVLIPVSVLLIKYYLEFGRYYNQWTGEPGFCGVGTDKNALGRLTMLSCIFVLWNLIIKPRSGWREWKECLPDFLILAMCLWVLHIANSQTSLGCFIIGIAVLFGSRLDWFQQNQKRLAWCGSILIVLSLLFFCFPSLRQIITTSMGRQVNLTDRTSVWSAVLAAGTDPIIGTGFGSFWLTPKGLSIENSLAVTEAHNGFLETYLNSGIIGVGLLLAVLLAAGKNVLRRFSAGSPNASLYASLFVAGLIYNYTEADFNTNSIMGFILWAIAMRPDSVQEVAVPVPANAGETGREISPAPNRPSIFAITRRKDA